MVEWENFGPHEAQGDQGDYYIFILSLTPSLSETNTPSFWILPPILDSSGATKTSMEEKQVIWLPQTLWEESGDGRVVKRERVPEH